MLEDKVRVLATGANFAAFTTLLPSGTPMTHTMWVDADADHVLINTEVHRQKFLNVSRNPRVSVMIWERGNPYHYVEVRGDVVETVTGPDARAHIDGLSQKYTGHAYAAPIQSERVILRIRPDRQLVRGEPSR
jgi:PPOX class probable F420-dependent enzyme